MINNKKQKTKINKDLKKIDKESKPKLSEKYAGKLSSKVADELLEYVSKIRS